MKRSRGVDASAAWWCSCGAHASGDAVTVENIAGEHSVVCPHQPACFNTAAPTNTYTRTTVMRMPEDRPGGSTPAAPSPETEGGAK